MIERVLGSGGFGITYLAKDTSLGRQVVIKENLPVQFCFRDTHSLTVSPRHSHGEDAENFQWSLENFSKEAAMLASLDHRGIVRVLRSFQAFGTAYFVMPFVEGMTFEDLIRDGQEKNGTFSEEEFHGFLTRVLKALSYLHDRGIYHRDIKPGNLLITHEGIPVLIDFGSARQRLSERSMTVVESAGYTPFEQLQSRGNVGPWSDLYALGGTLVKAITGETLPKANDRVFDDPWQALADREELLSVFSPRFLQSLDRALALHPRDRWQDAGEWLEALSAPATDEPPAERSSPVTSPTSVVLPERAIGRPSDPQPGEEREFDLTNFTKIQMCWIPPGGFLMGSPKDELGRTKDETQHQVKISQGFWMGKYPVTQRQWEAVMGNRPSYYGHSLLENLLEDSEGKVVWKGLPVEQVTWYDICGNDKRMGGFLGQANAKSPRGFAFDLPTGAEWEYACRAGTTGSYAGDLDSMAWYSQNSRHQTHQVGEKSSNDWGLHDMHGNVWEWCSDWNGAYTKTEAVDPQGPVTGFIRVIRGGAWISDCNGCRSANRHGFGPEASARYLGFRLVLRSKIG